MFVSLDRKKKEKCVKVDNYVRQAAVMSEGSEDGTRKKKQASAGRAPARQSWPLNAYRACEKHVGGGAVSGPGLVSPPAGTFKTRVHSC